MLGSGGAGRAARVGGGGAGRGRRGAGPPATFLGGRRVVDRDQAGLRRPPDRVLAGRRGAGGGRFRDGVPCRAGRPGRSGLQVRSVPQSNRLGTGIYVDPNTTGDFRSLAITTVVRLRPRCRRVARLRVRLGPAQRLFGRASGPLWRLRGESRVLVLVLSRLAQTLGENLADGDEAR